MLLLFIKKSTSKKIFEKKYGYLHIENLIIIQINIKNGQQ